jgi:DNA-binding CsgD family transcriptional regulator
MVGRRPAVTTGGVRAAALVERERELAAIADGLERVHAHQGRVVVVEAVAGRGKTALVEAARDLAVSGGVRVLWARARHLEATAPYNLLRRLLGPAVERRGGPSALSGAAAFAAELFIPGATLRAGMDYGCQSLLAGLADEGPQLVAVDDAHWADADSLRVVADLAADLHDERIMVVVAARPAENSAVQPMLARMATGNVATLLRPAPLTDAGVHAVLRDAFGSEPDEAFTAACARASDGNVFYLRELIRPLLLAGYAPDQVTAAKVHSNGSEALTRTVRARLDELGSDATRLARAAATLGDDASLGHAAELAGLTGSRAGQEAARLTAAAILARPEPIAFLHPLIRSAVERTAEPGVIAALHAGAADVLQAGEAPVRQVIQHLMAAPPAGSTQVCRLLLTAARHDLETGSAEVAYRLLTRALAEPPPRSLRPEVLFALARAERANGDIHLARGHLDEVVRSGSRGTSIAAMWDLLEVLYELDDSEAVTLLHRRALAAEPYGHTPEETRLRALLLAHAASGSIVDAPRRLTEVDVEGLPARSGEERHMLICAALYRRAAHAGSAVEFVGHLRRAVRDLPGDRPLTYRETYAALEAAAYLAASEAMDESDEILRRLGPDVARLRGVAPDLQAEWNHRVILNAVREGRFEDALAQLAGADDFARRYGLAVYLSFGNYARGCVALERGDYPEAGRLLLLGPHEGTTAPLGELLSGRPAEALALLTGAGYALARDAPVLEAEIQFEPHLLASHAYGELHDRAAALAEADREVAVRRGHGPPFRLALALRRRATFARNPAAAAALLCEAVQLCATTTRLPVRARVLAGYGAALRRDGRLIEARAQLTTALDLTDRLGMTRLRDRVVSDLRAAGGRVRRTRVSGVESLTESQRIVAERAVRGCTNRRIAEELYVSVKTVETHLAAVYRKLDVTGRDGLRDALAPRGLSSGLRP